MASETVAGSRIEAGEPGALFWLSMPVVQVCQASFKGLRERQAVPFLIQNTELTKPPRLARWLSLHVGTLADELQ